jgi:hypothetical protein
MSRSPGQFPQELGHTLELDEMELDVLACGQVPPAPAVGARYVRQGVQLLRSDRTVRGLDPHHLVATTLALTVDAVVEPEDPEGVLLQPPGEIGLQHPFELDDVGFELGRDVTGEDGNGHRPLLSVPIGLVNFSAVRPPFGALTSRSAPGQP